MANRLFGSPLVRRVVTNSSYLFSATGVVAVMGLVQNILTGRLLGVSGIGLLATIFMFTSVVNKFASFRMTELVVKYVSQFTEENDIPRASAVFKIAALAELVASVFAFILIWLLAPVAARLLAKDSALTGLFIFYGLIVLANLVSESSTGLLQVFDKYRWIAVLNVWGNGVTLAGISLVYAFFVFILPRYYQGQGYSGEILTFKLDSLMRYAMPAILVAYLVGKITGALSLTLIGLREAWRHWGKGWWKSPIRLLRPKARELAHFATSTNISATLNLVNKDAEVLWISLFRSPTEVGFYKTALSLINLVLMPVSPLPQATYPELSREVARKNWQNVREILRRGSILAGTFTLVISAGLVILGQQLILLLYKDPGFLPAYPALLILLPGFLVANTFYWNRIAMLALGKPDFPAKVNLVLAPRFGYLANAALLSGYYLIGVSIVAFKAISLIRQNAQSSEPTPGDAA
jgi:O-antigen/teichoic acid export membrane protein